MNEDIKDKIKGIIFGQANQIGLFINA